MQPNPIAGYPVSVSAPSSLRRSAEALETAFLKEMIMAAGLGRPPELAGGGEGEQVFASFTADAYAQAFMARGGVGLADHVERALTMRTGDGA